MRNLKKACIIATINLMKQIDAVSTNHLIYLGLILFTG